MKRAAFCLLALLVCGWGLYAQDLNQETDDTLPAYVFREESLLISESDLNCSFFIRDAIPETIRIIAPEEADLLVSQFTDNERMVINAGSRQGLKEGDVLQVVGKGALVRKPHGVGVLGRYFRKKALAVVSCLYENRAQITIRNACYPAEIGDFLLPYKAGQTMFEKMPRYTMCKLPARGIEGQVVWNDIYDLHERSLGADGSYLAVDIGAPRAKPGSFLLFFRRYAADLPPMILGVGVVIDAGGSNSTVKVLDTSKEVVTGDHVVLISGNAVQTGGEELPVVQGVADVPQPEPGPAPAQALSIELLFDFDSAALRPEHAAELEKVKEAVTGKNLYTVTLRGYACGIGREEYNLRLSQRRVEAIKDALVNQYGIDASRVEFFFYGEKESSYDNTAESERRKNRRVTLEVAGQ
jgi:outer membrane protein OmpA-like peptidoglycan-associated protein